MSDWIAAEWSAPEHIVAGTTLRSADTARLPGEPCFLNQVHGSNVVTAGHFDVAPEADASVNGSDPLLCAVRTADCLPLLMCSKDGKSFGAAHAGWRGLAAGVIENTVSKLDAKPSDVLVWLGPAISKPSFEVGDEVREAFLAHNTAASRCFEKNTRGRWQADLYELARQRLHATGVTYRRDPQCGRLVSFIGLKTP
jgi:YfiH family protein